MRCRGWRGGSLMLFVFAASALLGQSRSLNPTVTVLPRAVAPVPAECDIGPGPAPPEPIRVAELPQERSIEEDLTPPPSSDLRASLRTAQEAAERNDRDTFRDAHARAKTLLANYPPGAEKSAASEGIAVYGDLLRLWNYQFDAPAGAFFDAETEGGALLQMMNKYPGYAAFIADQTISAGGTRIYPTRESREFLTIEAARRLQRLGVRAPAPRTPARPTAPRTSTAEPAEDPSHALPSVVPRRRTPGATQPPSTTQPSRRTEPKTTATTPRRTTTPRASATPKPTPRRSQTPTRSTTTTTRAPQPSTPPVSRPVEPVSPPPKPPTDEELAALTGGVVATTTTSAPPPPIQSVPADTAMTPLAGTSTDTVSVTDTTVTETVTTDTAAIPQPVAAKGPNFIIPLILILIGIGVLIVLFRASS